MARPNAHHVARRLAARPTLGRRWLASVARRHGSLGCSLACSLGAATASAAVVPAQLVARVGDVPPGAAVALASTQPPFVLADGAVAFTGLLANGDAYVFLRNQVVWLGSNALGSMLVGAESSMGATAAGGYIYGPEVDGAEAVWTQNGLLALEGTPAPLYPAGYVTTFHSRPSMVGNGTAYWIAGLNASGGTTTQQRVLYRSPSASPAGIEVVLASGNMVGGLVVAGPTGIDLDYQVSENGAHLVMVVVMATGSTANDEHVYVNGALFHQENTPNGTGDNWDNFDLVAINDQGTYVFTGDTNGDVATDEFVAVNGVIAVREGSVIDGVALTASASVRMISVNDAGHIVHAWAYAGNSLETVFFACDPSNLGGSSLAVLTAGVDTLDLDGDGLGDALVTDLNASNATNTHALADDGSLYLEVDLDDMSGAGPVPAMVRLSLSCCGNGVLDDGEECDDGNGDDTDACPGTCMIATCGDGYTFAGIEECDDADLFNTDECLVSCVAASCGDGFLWSGVEACDDGDGDDSDGCPGSCMPAQCGDGYVWAGMEECDDGNQDDTDACHRNCVAATCGDGWVWFGVEECDDGDDDDGDECPGSCMIARCGDGYVLAGVEECDDGNDDDADGCARDCTLAGDGSSGGSSGSDGTGDPGSTSAGSSSGAIDLDDTAGSGQADTGVPMPASDSSGGASTGETEAGPFGGLDDDGGCSCVAGREHAARGTLGSLMGLLVLGLRLRRRRR